MQVRFSTALGTPIVDDESGEQVGIIAGILIQPDTGKVEGFFVRVPSFFHAEELFLSSIDILRWGRRVAIRTSEMLCPITDRVRLHSLFEEKRYVIGQRIVTESGRNLGRCGDVQFDTLHFVVVSIWPRWWWKWGNPLPVSSIIEVRKDAIVVRDPAMPSSEKISVKAPILDQMPEVA